MALWVDREHGEDAEDFIAGKVLHFEETGYTGWEGALDTGGPAVVELRDALTAQPN